MVYCTRSILISIYIIYIYELALGSGGFGDQEVGGEAAPRAGHHRARLDGGRRGILRGGLEPGGLWHADEARLGHGHECDQQSKRLSSNGIIGERRKYLRQDISLKNMMIYFNVFYTILDHILVVFISQLFYFDTSGVRSLHLHLQDFADGAGAALEGLADPWR